MATAQQAARITDPITHGLGLIGIAGGMLVGAVAGVILIAALPVTAPALLVGLTAAAAVGAVAGGGLAGHQLLAGIQRACALPSPTTGMVGAVGSPNVRIGNLPAARVVSDVATSCNGLYALSHLPIPPLPQAQIAEGAHTIRINGLLAARVSSKLTCGASIQRGALTVYFGGPTERVLAVFDLESLLLSGLGFVAKASLIAMSLLTIPLGVGAMATFAVVFGGFAAVNYGLGRLGNQIGPGWGDILQGGFGLAAILGGSVLGAKALGKSEPAIEPAELNSDSFSSYARPSEQATAERLAESHREFDGEIFEAAPAPDPGYDWTDSSGRTYDAMGDGTKSKYFDLDQFTDSIDHHLLKGNDFTVIDMTGYSPEQAAAVRDYVDSLPPRSTSKYPEARILMLSIRFDAKREWWVSGMVFDRIFNAAKGHGELTPRMDHWRNVANANGGLSLSSIPFSDAHELIQVIRHTAERDLAGLGAVESRSADESYRAALEKLLALTENDQSPYNR